MNTVQIQGLYTEKRAFMLLSCTVVLLFALYVYFVSASIVHVVLRTEIGSDITLLSSEISELEGKYIEVQHKVSSDIASLQGYQKTKSKIFIDRNEDSLVLSNGGTR
jgi:hypothetical protein